MTPRRSGAGSPTGPWRPQGNQGETGAGFLPLPPLRELADEWIGGLSKAQVSRLLRDANAAIWSLNWMHGAGRRPISEAHCSAATREHMGRLRLEVQQRAVLAARQWIDVDSAISEKGPSRSS